MVDRENRPHALLVRVFHKLVVPMIMKMLGNLPTHAIVPHAGGQVLGLHSKNSWSSKIILIWLKFGQNCIKIVINDKNKLQFWILKKIIIKNLDVKFVLLIQSIFGQILHTLY